MTKEFSEQLLSLQEKLDVLCQVDAPFVPQSPRELHEAFSLLSFDPVKHGGAAGHLNEILIHQKRSNADHPENAVISVTREYAGYYTDAEDYLKYLEQLKEVLDQPINPNLHISDVDELSKRGRVAKALTRSIFYIDLDDSMSRGKIGDFPWWSSEVGAQKAKNDYILRRMGELSVNDIRRAAPSVIASESNRGLFWYDRLRESRNHAIAKPIVDAVLS
jgi:hypothetical protein